MSGGVAYVLDENDLFTERCNHGMVELEDVVDDEDVELLRSLVQRHADYTCSPVAERLLSDWDKAVRNFVKVMPVDYKRVLLARRNVSLELVG
jgi:glutamate synthase (NADPH) large chain